MRLPLFPVLACCTIVAAAARAADIPVKEINLNQDARQSSQLKADFAFKDMQSAEWNLEAAEKDAAEAERGYQQAQRQADAAKQRLEAAKQKVEKDKAAAQEARKKWEAASGALQRGGK